MKLPTIPDKAPIIGGPFDGREYEFDIQNWEPDEQRYQSYYNKGIIEDLTMFNIEFPEGAIYKWNYNKLQWEYKGPPDDSGFKRFLKFFNKKPNKPL